MLLGAGFLVLVSGWFALVEIGAGFALAGLVFALVRPVCAVGPVREARWSRSFALVRPDGAGVAGSRWRGGARWCV